MLSPAEAAAVARGLQLKRYIRAAAAMQGIYDDAALGEAVRVHRRTVAGWWQGSRPSPETLRQLAEATGLQVDELGRFIYYDGPPPHLPGSEEAEAQDRAAAAERSRRVPRAAGASEAPRAPRETTGSGR